MEEREGGGGNLWINEKEEVGAATVHSLNCEPVDLLKGGSLGFINGIDNQPVGNVS